MTTETSHSSTSPMRRFLYGAAAAALTLGFASGVSAQQSDTTTSARPAANAETGTKSEMKTDGAAGASASTGQSKAADDMKAGTTASGTATTGTTTAITTDAETEGRLLIGKEVLGANDEEVGEVEDVIVDSSGKIKAVLIDVGGFLGMGGKEVAIPMNDLTVMDEHVVASSLSKESAESMPEYKAAEDERRGTEIYKTQVEKANPLPPSPGSVESGADEKK